MFLHIFLFSADKITKKKRPTEVDLYFVYLGLFERGNFIPQQESYFKRGSFIPCTQRVVLKEGVLGMRSTNNQSLLNVNEDCEYKQ